MTYQYHCPKCQVHFDVIKSYRQIDAIERCGHCDVIAIRDFVPSRIHLSGTSVEHAEYNPGLGCIVRNKSHRKELCKIKGVEEIGNEKPERLHQHFERVREENREKAWSEADKGWVGDGTS